MNDLRRRYLGLSALILDPAWVPFWSASVLQNWPWHASLIPRDWVSAALGLGEDEKMRFLDGEVVSGLPGDLRDFMSRANELCDLPRSTDEVNIDVADEQGLTPKKTHEIRRLLPLLGDGAEGFSRAVDIGGGKGHLARTCIRLFGWHFTTIDRDLALQDKGRWWLQRTRRLPREKLVFVNASVENAAQELDGNFSGRDTFSVGLHTCGPLALTHMRKSIGAGAMINVGCCFDKIDLAEAEANLNLSEAGRATPIPWTKHALYLATRGRYRLAAEEFRLLEKVYGQRFTLQLWLKAFHPEAQLITVGDAPAALYRESFKVYAANRLEHLGFAPESSWTGLETFATQPDIAAQVNEMIAIHHIRNLWARPLEVALLLDRALWQEEQGWEVSVKQVFDRELSPRNIAIISRAREGRSYHRGPC